MKPLRAATRREALPVRRTNSADGRRSLEMRFRLPRIRGVHPPIPRLGFAPKADGRPDPGEVVWAWVAYEDDPTQGKDRPVLVIGSEGTELLALAMTSRDHDVDAAQESRDGREWMDIGSGAWDAQRRPSEVRLNRVLRLDPDDVRREGAAVAEDVFEAVLEAARPYL